SERLPAPDAAFGADGRAFSVAYTLTPAAWGVMQSGAEVALGFRRQSNRSRLWLRATYDFPAAVNVEGAGMRWQRLSLTFGPTLAARGRRVWLEVGAFIGGVVTLTERSGAATPPDGATKMDRDLDVIYAGELGFGVRVAQHAALYAMLRFSLTSDADLRDA